MRLGLLTSRTRSMIIMRTDTKGSSHALPSISPVRDYVNPTQGKGAVYGRYKFIKRTDVDICKEVGQDVRCAKGKDILDFCLLT